MKINLNNLLWLLLFTLGICSTNAQSFVSINNATIIIAPSYTLNNGDAFTVVGAAKNTGTNTITSNVHVHFAIDTSSTVGIKKYLTRVSNTYPQSNFLPSATFTFSLADNADVANAYRTSGNGVSVVIWATVGSNPLDPSATKDSVYAHIYVLPPLQSINDEHAFEQNHIIVQNPATSVLSFELLVFNNEPILLDLINSNGECVITQLITTKNSTLKTTNLSSGMYYLRFTNNKTNKTITKKIIIN